MCPNCRAFITTSDKVCPYCDMKLQPAAAQRRSPSPLLGGLIPHARFTTVVILLINTGLYIAMAIHSGSAMDFSGRTMLDFGAKWGPALQAGQWWRLITAGFLHGGLWHILMNSWVLFDLGAATEESYGTPRFLVFYIFSNVTGFYASYLWAPGSLSVGSSAGIFGLLGAMIALGVRDRTSYGAAIRAHYVQWGIYALLLSALFSATDNAAHIGGLAGGFAVAYLAGTPRYSPTAERLWEIAAGGVVLVTAIAFAFMVRWLIAGAGA
jgi:rhomboid protease GluP